MNSTRLHTFNRGSEVRHLLIEGEDNSARVLSTLVNGQRSELDRGPLYKMEEKANSVTEQWMKEGFKYRDENGPPVYEPFRHFVALAKLMGHTRVMQSDHMPISVPLDRWPGCRDKNGDDYEYGYAGLTMYAQPRVTAKHGVNMRPANNQELMEEIGKVIEIRTSLGPNRTFILD